MNVVSLALRDPLLVAKQCATIDVLSEGRLLPAFGTGSPLAPEWQTLSRDIASRGRKTPSLPTRASPAFLTCGRWQDPARPFRLAKGRTGAASDRCRRAGRIDPADACPDHWRHVREADMLALTWKSYDGKAFEIRQAKTGEPLWVPAHKELRIGVENRRGEIRLSAGWGARIRTWEWRNQNPLPYHLATPHRDTYLNLNH
jgi:hypothetical protein